MGALSSSACLQAPRTALTKGLPFKTRSSGRCPFEVFGVSKEIDTELIAERRRSTYRLIHPNHGVLEIQMKKKLILVASAIAGFTSQNALAQSPLPTSLEPRLAPVMRQCPEMSDPDNEYGGNGPNVILEATTRLVSGNKQMELELDFQAEETVSDWSEAVERNGQRLRPVLEATQCTVYTSITSGTNNRWTYTDVDKNLDKQDYSPPALVKEFHVRGDTSNSDIDACTSDDTKFWAWFNESSVTLDVDPSCQSEDTSPQVVNATPRPVLAQASSIRGSDVAGRSGDLRWRSTPLG